MGLLVGVLVLVGGVILIRYGVGMITAGVTAIFTWFGLHRRR